MGLLDLRFVSEHRRQNYMDCQSVPLAIRGYCSSSTSLSSGDQPFYLLFPTGIDLLCSTFVVYRFLHLLTIHKSHLSATPKTTCRFPTFLTPANARELCSFRMLSRLSSYKGHTRTISYTRQSEIITGSRSHCRSAAIR